MSWESISTCLKSPNMALEKKVLLPNEINNSRVYLADFDRVTYSQVAWTEEDVDELILNYQRKIKLLLLVKGHVIIPLPHLTESELAREVIGNSPDLFSCGAVLPTLPPKIDSAQDFLQFQIESLKESNACLYRGSEPQEMAALMDETAHFVRWEDRQSMDWFRQRLLADMQDPLSLLRLTFQARKLKLPRKTIRRLEKIENFARTDVYLAAKEIGDLPRWELLSTYADFLYYLGDALSVESEGLLPQENLLDFSLSDLVDGKTRLNEFEVFTKVFIDTVKAVTSTHFPADFLDTLSIADAIELHTIAMQNEFIDKYHSIQKITKDGLTLHDPERLVLTLTELETYEQELQQQFETALQRELPSHLREHRALTVGDMLHTIATLVIPFYGNIDAARELLISGLAVIGRDDVTKRVSRKVSAGVDAAERLVDRRDTSDRVILLDFVGKMKNKYQEYL